MLPTDPGRIPWGTFVINVSGSLVIGLLLAVLTTRFAQRPMLRPMLATGFLGGYTTFSTYAVEAEQLFRGHDVMTGLVYVVASLFAGLGATFVGMLVARRFLTVAGERGHRA